MPDEFGGVEVEDSSDEFGGIPIAEDETPDIPAEEILSRPAIPAWMGARGELPGEDVLAPSSLSGWDRFRNTRIGHSLLGPTETEREAQVTPFSDPGIIPVARQMLKMTSVPPPIADEIRTLTQASAETPLLGEAGKGISKGVREVALNTPLAPFGPAGEIAMPLFAGEFAFSVPEQKAEYEKALKEGRTEDAARIATEFAVGGALVGAGTKHEATRTLNRFKKNVEPTSKTIEPRVLPEPAPEPQVETRTQEVYNGTPVEVLEVNKKKGTALMRPEGEPDAAPDVVPYGEIETREVPVEKGPNASSESKTATVYGDVRASAREGPREVPAEEGSGGVQSQAAERVQPAEGQNREVSLAEKESGWTSSPIIQIGGIKVESLTPKELAKLTGAGNEIEFTDRRPGSITEGSTLYFPKDATREEIISRMDEELSKKVAKLSPDEWQAYADSLHKSDIGREAVTRRLAASAEKGGFVDDLKAKADEIANRRQEELKKAREAKSPEEAVRYIERGGLLSDQAQFFNEAHEFAKASAQGKGSVKESGVSVGPGGASPSDVGTTKSDMAELTQAIEGTASPKESISDRLAKAKQVAATLPTAGKNAIKRGLLRLQAIGSAIKSGLTKLPEFTNYKRILGQWNGANQIADHELRQFVKTIDRTIPKPRQEAMINWIQADGNADILRQRAADSKPKFRKGYEDALRLTDDEKTAARNISSYLDARLQAGIDAGLLQDGVEQYITQIWKRENPITKKLVGEFSTAKLQPNFKYARQRIFDSYFEGEQAGYQPANKTVSAAVAAYDQSFNRALASRAFVKALTEGKAADGRPLVEVSGTGSAVPKEGVAKAILINPKIKSTDLADYRTIDHPALRKWMWQTKAPDGTPVFVKGDLLVHPEIYRHLKNVLGTSAWRQNLAGRIILGTESTLKQAMFSLSGFHQVQETLHALGHRVNPARLEKVDFSQPWQKEAVEHGLQVADYNALEKFGEGLNSGHLINKIPLLGTRVMGPYTEWLFQDYIPRLKLTMYREALARNMERYAKQITSGKLTRDQVIENTAKQANAAFGELNYTWMGRNKTLQDTMRAFLVAPDFLEARAKFVGQAARSHGREQLVALGLLAATQYLTARILNKVLDDDPHWELKNAFSLVKGKHKYELRTIPGDLIHLMEDPHRFTTSRLAPIVRQAIEFVEGRDWRGVKRDAAEQLKDLAKVAVPISLKPYEGQRLWESALNAFGVHERHYTANDQIREKAKSFLKDHKISQHQPEPTDEVTYGKLRMAISNGNKAHAQDVLAELLKTHPPDKVFDAMQNHIGAPFTGSQKHEQQFKFSLTPKELQLYQKAMAERRQEFADFKRLWYNRTRKK